MSRRLFTALSIVSLVLCIGTAALWVHGTGRTAGWYFRPSPEFTIPPPDPSQPARWCVQWQINWGRDGRLILDRQVKPAREPMRRGFFSVGLLPSRWNPLPEPLPIWNPNIAAISFNASRNTQTVVMRRTPATEVRLLGLEYTARDQEFGQFPSGGYFAGTGGRCLRVPLLYLFVAFSVAPILRCRRAWQRWRNRGCCDVCGYNLTGNTSGVCPECGTPTTAGVKR